jgi:hypothetical protein
MDKTAYPVTERLAAHVEGWYEAMTNNVEKYLDPT